MGLVVRDDSIGCLLMRLNDCLPYFKTQLLIKIHCMVRTKNAKTE